MLTDPQVVLNRVECFPHLKAFVKPQWVQQTAKNRSVAIWHPFFEEHESFSTPIMSNLDRVIGYLLRENVVGTETRARRLCEATTQDNFWSKLTELVLGANLRKGYPLRYLPESGSSRTPAPDIELVTAGRPVYVEITARHQTWDFHLIERYIHAALDGLQHRYRINVVCRSDAVKLSEEVLEKLAERVRAYIVAEPDPTDEKTRRIFSSGDGWVAVDVRRSAVDEGYLLISTEVGGSPTPEVYFRQIMKRVEDKAPQFAKHHPGVCVVDLANGVGSLAPLGGQDNLWEFARPLFRLDALPDEIDLVILTWVSIFGEMWDQARALRMGPLHPLSFKEGKAAQHL